MGCLSYSVIWYRFPLPSPICSVFSTKTNPRAHKQTNKKKKTTTNNNQYQKPTKQKLSKQNIFVICLSQPSKDVIASGNNMQEEVLGERVFFHYLQSILSDRRRHITEVQLLKPPAVLWEETMHWKWMEIKLVDEVKTFSWLLKQIEMTSNYSMDTSWGTADWVSNYFLQPIFMKFSCSSVLECFHNELWLPLEIHLPGEMFRKKIWSVWSICSQCMARMSRVAVDTIA